MRYSKIFLIAFSLLIYNTVSAQSFKIGTLDIYGNRNISAATILAKLSVRIGDSVSVGKFSPPKEVQNIKAISGVKDATVNSVCCDTSGNLMLFIGICETNSCMVHYRNAPQKNILLPDTIVHTQNRFDTAYEDAVLNGQAGEDDSNGYALYDAPDARKEQQKFILFVDRYFTTLEDVLKNSSSAEQRATAAEIIAYSSDRKTVVKDLLYAIDDPDDGVRNNATRALAILAGYSADHPSAKLKIPAAPFIKMLNSVVWTDRNKGANVLMHLTKTRDPKILHSIKQQALSSIIEMAKWEDRGHAVFSFILLGRIAGIDEKLLWAEDFSPDWRKYEEEMVEKCKA